MEDAELKLEVTCSICTDIYTHPVTLLCGHSFCNVCITRTFDNQRDREYFCPECMKRFWRRPEITRNPRLSNIANLFRSIKEKGDKPENICSYCVHFHVPAVALCLHCEAFLCDLHKQTHSETPEHILTDPTTSKEDTKCPVHKKILEYYCSVDETCICAQCLTSDHNGHRVNTISEFLQQRAKNLKPVLETLSAKRKETEAMLQRLQDHKTKLENEADGVAERVTAIMKDIRRQQHDLEQRVLSEISRHKEQISFSACNHIQQLDKEKSELHQKITQIEALSRTTKPISALENSKVFFSVLEDEYNLDRGLGSKVIHNVGDMKEDVILKTLYSGLADIIVGVGKDDHVKDVRKSSLSADSDNANIANRNVFIEAKTPKRDSNAPVHSHTPSKAQIQASVPEPRKLSLIRAKNQNVPLVSTNKSSTPEMLLDVNTASNYLLISDDLKTVSRSDVYRGRPETPERFQNPQVLSTRGISSGKHVLEMEISKTNRCDGDSLFIGMCYPTIDRRGSQSITRDSNIVWGLWVIDMTFHEVQKNNELKSLRKVSSQRIKLELDYKAGQMSFYDLCDPIKHVHTFNTTFTQPLHLIVSVEGNCWVKILKWS